MRRGRSEPADGLAVASRLVGQMFPDDDLDDPDDFLRAVELVRGTTVYQATLFGERCRELRRWLGGGT